MTKLTKLSEILIADSKVGVINDCTTAYIILAMSMEDEIERLKGELLTAKQLLDIANCPDCDKSGFIYDSYGNPEQCRWCFEVKKINEVGL